MKLISCYVENFGKLSDFRYEFKDGLNLIAHENGWGKSTLMGFIKCMFYGLTGDGKRSAADSERKRFSPWQGGVFGGRLRFEVDGRQYEVIRKWGKKAQEDECVIIDCVTNLPADRFIAATSGNAASLGRQLFGIDEDSFARSAFIAQGDVPGGANADINAKISNLADNTNDMGNYEKAMELFRNTLNAMSESRVTGSLHGQKSEINRLRGDILMEDSLEAGLRDLRVKAAEAKDRIGSLTMRNEALGRLFDEMTKWQDAQLLRERYKLYDKAVCEANVSYEDAQREERRAREADSGNVRMPGILIIAIVLTGMGITMALMGIIMHGADMLFTVIGLLVMGLGLVAGAVGAVMLIKAKKARKEAHEEYVAAKARLDDAQGAYIAARQRLDDYTREYGSEFLNANGGQWFTDESGRTYSSGSEISDEMRHNSDEIERLRGFAASYADQEEEKQEVLDSLLEKKKRLAELEEDFEAGRIKVRQLEMARDMLEEAQNNMTSRYIGPLTERFAHYYSRITGTGADSYSINAQSRISVDDKGARHDTETLSTGLKDAVGFCLRMALVDAMYKDRKPPVIMDDTFVNMDDNNYNGAVRVLSEVSGTYQVIYFTCHNMV